MDSKPWWPWAPKHGTKVGTNVLKHIDTSKMAKHMGMAKAWWPMQAGGTNTWCLMWVWLTCKGATNQTGTSLACNIEPNITLGWGTQKRACWVERQRQLQRYLLVWGNLRSKIWPSIKRECQIRSCWLHPTWRNTFGYRGVISWVVMAVA